MVGSNKVVPVSRDRPWRMFSILAQNTTPMTKAQQACRSPRCWRPRSGTPASPRRATRPWCAGWRCRRDLSFTSMIRPETMFSAATRMIKVRIRNITLRSTVQRLEEAGIGVLPGDQSRAVARGLGQARQHGEIIVGIGDHHFDAADAAFGVEEKLRFLQRHEDEAGVVLRHADAEGARHRIGLDPGRGAEGRDIALGRDQGDGAAGMQMPSFWARPAPMITWSPRRKPSSAPGVRASWRRW